MELPSPGVDTPLHDVCTFSELGRFQGRNQGTKCDFVECRLQGNPLEIEEAHSKFGWEKCSATLVGHVDDAVQRKPTSFKGNTRSMDVTYRILHCVRERSERGRWHWSRGSGGRSAKCVREERYGSTFARVANSRHLPFSCMLCELLSSPTNLSFTPPLFWLQCQLAEAQSILPISLFFNTILVE